MDDRQSIWLVVIAGLILAFNPLFWTLQERLGIAFLFGWIDIAGPRGAFLSAVGVMYVAAGSLAILYSMYGWDYRRIVAGTAFYLAVVWVALQLWWQTVIVGGRSVSWALGMSPILLSFLVGITEDYNQTRRVVIAAIALFIPYVVWGILTMRVRGGFGSFFIGLSILSLGFLDIVFGYPLYRFGKRFAEREPAT